MPRPIIVFASCDCVKKSQVAIQALFQESFDGELIHFTMVCLLCDTPCLIAEPFNNYADLKRCEEEVMDYLAKSESDYYLELVMTGKTYSRPPVLHKKGHT